AEDREIEWSEVGLLLLVYAGVNLAIMLTGIVGKRLVLWRATPGRYPLWGFYYFRWWLSRQLAGYAHLGYMQGTPLAAAT
ncbi:hypothetical protein ABTL49_19635, partial [Acinetobacter baumannii]